MIVLDASVIAKWFLGERGSEKALQYRDLHAAGKERIFVPGLLLYELANLFRYKQGFNREDTLRAFKSLSDFGLEVVHFYFDDAARAALLAERLDITVYDAAYVEVALRFNCLFVTADEKLFERVRTLGIVELL